MLAVLVGSGCSGCSGGPRSSAPQAPAARVDLADSPPAVSSAPASVAPSADVPPDPDPPDGALPPPGPFNIRGASSHYDFRLTLHEACDANMLQGGVCVAPGALVVFAKGSDVPLQEIPLDSVAVVTDDGGHPLVNSARLYDWQGTLEVGDFDFDGHEDFAVQDSEQGPYGGPTFQVFLYKPASSRFECSDEMSDLTRRTLGFFQVDPRSKRITTFAKGGCCWHVTEQYAVRRAGRLVIVSRVTEDARDGVLDDSGRVRVTTEKLVGGRWITSTRTVHQDP